MTGLIVAQLVLGVVGLLVVLFVAFPYRGRGVPHAQRLSEKVAEVAERVDPGEAPPLGVLTDPAKSRHVSQRFERAEARIHRAFTVLGLRRSA